MEKWEEIKKLKQDRKERNERVKERKKRSRLKSDEVNIREEVNQMRIK